MEIFCSGEEGEKDEKAVPKKLRIHSLKGQEKSEGPATEKQPLALPIGYCGWRLRRGMAIPRTMRDGWCSSLHFWGLGLLKNLVVKRADRDKALAPMSR